MYKKHLNTIKWSMELNWRKMNENETQPNTVGIARTI